MSDYTLAIGTHDPVALAAATSGEAMRQAIDFIAGHNALELSTNPQEVVTLIGPEGLVTRPGERLDEFVQRMTGSNPAADPNRVQPGDTTAPDCNGD